MLHRSSYAITCHDGLTKAYATHKESINQQSKKLRVNKGNLTIMLSRVKALAVCVATKFAAKCEER